jgi:protocatechuate 3,4-dioxygenase beta subunit
MSKYQDDLVATMTPATPDDSSVRKLSRRQVLLGFSIAGAASALGGLGSRAWAQACAVTGAQTQGPYWADEMLNRADITEGQAGVPLALTLNVLRADAGCAPAAGVQVDIWHCSAGGVYSDFAAEGTAGETWLRGFQVTDVNGAVQFQTIYPGWYVSRTIHIHFRVRTFDGSTTTYNFAAQLYFDDATSDSVIANNAEYQHGTRGITNSNDMLYTAATELELAADGNGGYAGTFDVALNGLPETGTTTSTTTTTLVPCTDIPVTDPKAVVILKRRNDAGNLRAAMVIDLADYAGEPVAVSLSDGDSPTIAAQTVGTLLPVGRSGKKWQFKSNADGVQRVMLRSLAPRSPGKIKLSVNARRWFTAAAADQSAAATLLAVQIGSLCFTHSATKVID